jgi:hypothetical protein
MNMKRILGIMTLALAVLVVPNAMASSNAGKDAKFRFGVKAGANVSNFMTADGSKLDFTNASLANFTGGATVEWLFWKGLGIDAGVMYTAKGTEYKAGDDIISDIYTDLMGTNSVMKATIHYLEVPVNIKYKLSIKGLKELIAPFVYVGPSFAFKLGEEVSFGDTNIKENEVDFNAVDVALNVGLGVEIIKHLNVSAQYGWGLGTVVDDFKILGESLGTLDLKSGVWTVTVAWMF